MTAKVVSFVAKSGTGKTTLLEKVIVHLKDQGYKVGVIKHDAHRFDIDHPGKDSYRLTAAGVPSVNVTVTVGAQTSAPLLMGVVTANIGMFAASTTSSPSLTCTWS